MSQFLADHTDTILAKYNSIPKSTFLLYALFGHRLDQPGVTNGSQVNRLIKQYSF